MRKDRLLAFSDGVFAIIITIMVLELKVPHEPTWAALMGLAPKLLSYVLSFIYVAIYWNNHHHMFETVRRVNGTTLWANMALLFFLSLIPFATAWTGETYFAKVPTAIYGCLLLLCAFSYTLLQRTLIAVHADNALLADAVGVDWKGKVSLALYVTGIGIAFAAPWISLVLFAIVALIWLVPDPRIEKAVARHNTPTVD
jgi:uncharacterized membrane protein